MSQNSLTLPTTGVVSGLAMTQSSNLALDSLNTLNSGGAAPSSAEAGSLWHNTSSNTLQIRNLANSAWIPLGALDETNNIWMPPIGGAVASSIAASSTTDLWSVPQTYLSITGSSTISAFSTSSTVQIGTAKFATFTSSLTLTYNSSQLILPTQANIVTSAGDMMLVMCLGAGNTKVAYFPINGKAVASSGSTVILNNYIAGLYSTAQSSTSTTSSTMTISSGQATDSTNTVMFQAASSFSWSIANGNAANGYAGGSSLPSSATIHFYVIAKTTDTSWTASFAASSTTPTLPSSYSSGYYRRIFSLITANSGIIFSGTAVEVWGGGIIYWTSTQLLDINVSSMTSSARSLYNITVPSGIKVSPIYRANGGGITSQAFIFTSPDEADVLPTETGNPFFTTAPGYDYATASTNVPYSPNAPAILTTNTSGQIGARATSTTTTLAWVTRGWQDFRRV